MLFWHQWICSSSFRSREIDIQILVRQEEDLQRSAGIAHSSSWIDQHAGIHASLVKIWERQVYIGTSLADEYVCKCMPDKLGWMVGVCLSPTFPPFVFSTKQISPFVGDATPFFGVFFLSRFFYGDNFGEAASLWGYWWVRAPLPPALHQFPCRQPERPAVGWSKMAAFAAEEFQKSNLKRSDFQIMRRLC